MYEDEHYIFIAYADVDKDKIKEFIERLKRYLPKNAVFFAKEDMLEGGNWEKILPEKIKKASIIIPMISKNFRYASYPDQEIGIGLGLNKIIYPIKLDQTNPSGFIHSQHADDIKKYTSYSTYSMIQLVIKLIEKMEIPTREIIKHSHNIRNYYETDILAEILEQKNDVNSKDIDILKKALESNDQIHDCGSGSRIKKFIEEFEQKNNNILFYKPKIISKIRNIFKK